MKEVNIKPLINLSVAELMVVNCRTWGYLVPTFCRRAQFSWYEYVPVESMQKSRRSHCENCRINSFTYFGLESIKSKKSKVVGGLNNYFSLD
jgi:hypothetical protein